MSDLRGSNDRKTTGGSDVLVRLRRWVLNNSGIDDALDCTELEQLGRAWVGNSSPCLKFWQVEVNPQREKEKRMGMFLVNKGVASVVIRPNKKVARENIEFHELKKNQVFDKSELVVDPYMKKVDPKEGTLGQSFMQNGWYGFRKGGWLVFIHRDSVVYG